MARMAGALFSDMEAREEVAASSDFVNAFLNLPFEEALEFFANREILTPEEFNALREGARADAFTARRLLSSVLRERAFDELVRVLDSDGNFSTFQQGIRNQEITLGVDPSSNGYLRTVYSTNIATAYSRGKREGISQRTRGRRPIIVRRANLDGRVRAKHAAAHNVGIRWTHPDSDTFTGPWGFGCRCSFVTMTEEQAESRGIRILDDDEPIPSNMGPDPFFDP